LTWKAPEDLELAAECETLPEAEVVRGLLASEGIESTIVSASDSTIVFSQKSVFGLTALPVPYKVLVRPEEAEAARQLLSAKPEEIPDGE
jgi:hypothetical protein